MLKRQTNNRFFRYFNHVHGLVICINIDMKHERQSNLIKIGEAAKIIGVTTTTLRRWGSKAFCHPH